MNLVFGMGGALLQQVNRDTLKFAYKACAAQVDNEWIPVYKDPVTDHGKHSKRGRQMLYRNQETGKMFTSVETEELNQDFDPVLETVFENGKLVKEQLFDEIRQRSEVG